MKMKIHLLERYAHKNVFESLSENDVLTLKEEIFPLILSTDEDELAKIFDYLIYTIKLTYLEKDQ